MRTNGIGGALDQAPGPKSRIEEEIEPPAIGIGSNSPPNVSKLGRPPWLPAARNEP